MKNEDEEQEYTIQEICDECVSQICKACEQASCQDCGITILRGKNES